MKENMENNSTGKKSSLKEALQKGEFAVTCEIGPPKGVDTGHCNITSSLYNHSGLVECLPEIKNYLCHLHIHDNFGKSDDHYLPFRGNIDWKGFVKDLKEINYPGVFMFELRKKTNNEEMLRTIKESYCNLIV
ncbi:MAG: TIM barrel protein [Candidatus Atribacteria bacterium]|nr:TIM barrel protein [Candidatus Atribacteria bacterium]